MFPDRGLNNKRVRPRFTGTWKAGSVPILLTCPLFIASVRRDAPTGRQGSVPVPLESAGLTPFLLTCPLFAALTGRLRKR